MFPPSRIAPLALLIALAGSRLLADDAVERIDRNLALLVQTLDQTSDPQAQADILRGIVAGMQGRRSAKMPPGWSQLAARLARSPNEEVRRHVQALGAIFGDAGTLDTIGRTVCDPSASPEERHKALTSLIERNDPALPELLRSLLGDAVLREQAVAALGLRDEPQTPAAILELYASFDGPTRRAALNTLAFRVSFARQLMKAVDEKKVPTGDFTAYTIRQLRTLGDPTIDAWVTRTWGVARASPEQKLKEIEKYKAMLTPQALAAADPSAGRALFAKTCQQCHTLFGVGGKVGPDITASARQDIDYLLSNIIDPSAIVARDYQVTNIWTKDDQILSGIVSREDEASITLVTESTSTTIQKSEIDQRKTSEMSIMPEGQLLPMKPQEVVNLIAYIRSVSQVPLPAGQK